MKYLFKELHSTREVPGKRRLVSFMFCGSPWAIPSPQHPCTPAPSLLLAPSALGFVGRRGRGMLGDQSLPLAMIATIVSDLLVGKDTTSLC